MLVILEQAINGVPDMRYMVSAATSAGEATIQIIFEPGYGPQHHDAVLNVQNRIQTAKQRLPPLVELEGIIVMQSMTSMLMYVNIYSEDPAHDQNFCYNYAFVDIVPEVKRIHGIGMAYILGSRQYAMRIWLDVDRMRAYNLTASDVMDALREQSMIGSPGRFGQATGVRSQTIEYVLTWVGRYDRPEQYENIILKAQSERRDSEAQGRCHRRDLSAFVLQHLLRHRRPCVRPPSCSKQLPGTNAAVIIERGQREAQGNSRRRVSLPA